MSGDRTTPPTTEEAGAVQALRAALDSANARAAAAESDRDRLNTQLGTERGARLAVHETSVKDQIAQAGDSIKDLEREWARQQAAGEFEAAAATMSKLASNTARLQSLKQEEQRVSEQRAAPAAPADPLASYTPAAQHWIRSNPRFMNDKAFQAKVISAHYEAVDGKKFAPDSREYFEHIEQQVYPERFQTAAAENPQPKPRERKEKEPPVATAENPLSQADNGDVNIVIEDQQTVVNPSPSQASNRQENESHLQGPELIIEQTPQVRAVGMKGAPGISAVAAAPSRSLSRLAANAAPSGQLTISREEMEIAQTLAESIEGAEFVREKGPIGIAQWYAGYYHSPAAQRKIAKWDAR